MSEHIDHAAEAREWIDAATRYPGAVGSAVLGVAEATLALVEQQRIANLIALSQVQDGIDLESALLGIVEANPDRSRARGEGSE